MASEFVRTLIDSGIHFGHRSSRWNPKMKPYIHSKRNSIHIIDIRETVKGLLRAKRFLAQVVSKGGDVLFVGTKRQARDSVRDAAMRVSMPWVADRWLGGALTNFRTIRSRLARLEELEAARADGRIDEYGKKQRARMNREYRKILRNLQGIRNMSRLPAALFVIDTQREALALREARSLGIPTIGLIDTDSDPDTVDIAIPGNDDSMRAIEAVLAVAVEGVEEGLRGRAAAAAEEEKERARRRSQREATARASESAEAGEAPPASDATATPGLAGAPQAEAAAQSVPDSAPASASDSESSSAPADTSGMAQPVAPDS